ncbi:pentatricopeptide repeat-containing protein At3g12770-like isoform X1 [Cucurbita pepo subsp. pepo]|uniref:pentatricopeptide repeat-containing protein At3g12770-like isoform X1 n=1 Tax=Cucurbita pepo subsp. pepo TaxID=3664 RepID=UPI000C9D4CC9|nr:pentatricopeptide repeat-containing protein At3g12770-like isoform X1 [Cucurbita pepo subsp. pepo]
MNLVFVPKPCGLFISHCYSTLFGRDLYPPQRLLHILQHAINQQSQKFIRESHAQVITHGLEQNNFLITKLISAYSTCGDLNESTLIFDLVSTRTVCIWNSLINGYVKNCVFHGAFHRFNEMQQCDIVPDDFTLSTLAKASSELRNVTIGKSIHGKIVRLGFIFDIVVANSLISMYFKYGECKESLKLFDEMPERNSGSWNVLLAGYASSNDCFYVKEAWDIVVRSMQIDGVKPDAFTISSLLPLCGNPIGKLNYGKELHCYIVKNELDLDFGSNVHLGCGLIDMYSRDNKITASRHVFDQIKRRNIYVWTAMVRGYVQNKDPDKALILFQEMQMRDGILPNRISLISLLPACNSLAGLMNGKQIHGFAIRKGFNDDASLCNALIDMYSKCGSLEKARKVFESDSFHKDTISWTTLISAYGLHGQGKESIRLYNDMIKLGIKPDQIAVVGVLSACSRSGLIKEGLQLYSTAVQDYRVEPTAEICAVIVDMLGNMGELEQALNFIKMMPVEPGPSVWGALVSASIRYKDYKILELAYRSLIELEPENPSNFISLSNLYASASRWDLVAELRHTMKERGLRKSPGCSWININTKTHCFHVADKAHPSSKLIYEVLDHVFSTMNEPISDDLEYWI